MSNSYQNHFKNLKKTTTQIPNTKQKLNLKKNEDIQSLKFKLASSTKPKMNPNRKPQMNLSTPIFMFLGITVTGWGYLNLESIMSWVEKIEVSAMPRTIAAEDASANNAQSKSKEEVKSSATPSTTDSETSAATNVNKPENLSYFAKLNDRKKELDQREKELNELETELQQQRNEVESRIKKLEEIRAQIGQVLKDKVEVDEERVTKLVEFYSNMKPQNAAQIIATLNEDLAVEILGRMKKKNAADILNLLKSEKAQVLTEKFAGYKRR